MDLPIPADAAASGLAPREVEFAESGVPRFRQRREMNRRFRARIDTLHQSLLRRHQEGEDRPASSQILEELNWLVNYTDRVEAAEERLAALRASLESPAEQQFWAREQDPADGSWGGAFTAWFLRLHATVDPLRDLLRAGGRPRHPLRLLEPVDSPQKIVAYFESLLVSQPTIDGLDRRKELNLAVTALGQLLFLPEMAAALPRHWPRAAVAAALERFMDEVWQNPDSGYWGAWYRVEDRLIKTDDLSITFHVASYRRGRIGRLPQLVRTTYRNRDFDYPYGWHDRGTQNCHHAYNVVRLLRLGWPHMSAAEKRMARTQLQAILDRALHSGVAEDGSFDPAPYLRTTEAYYFGVSLFDEIGYFRPARNFWSQRDFAPASESLRRKILRQLQRFAADDPMIRGAHFKLMANEAAG